MSVKHTFGDEDNRPDFVEAGVYPATIKRTEEKILDLNSSFLTDESGGITGVVAAIRDVTEIKDLNEEIARHKRLAALGKLSSGIAHEIRNPLSSIRGLAQFVYNSFSKTDERKEDLNTIIQEVDRLNKLVVQVLDFAKLKSQI